MAQNQERGKKPAMQEWIPDPRLRVLYKIWMSIYTTAKVMLGAAATVLLIGVVCGFALVGVLADYLETGILPTASLVLEDYMLDAPSYVYNVNSDGQIEKLQELYSTTDWKKAELEEIPDAMIHAAVAIEDKRFYEHQGVDWVTTIKAFANMFFGSETVGGSSITQQLIKNVSGENEATIQRKVQEIFRAFDVDEKLVGTLVSGKPVLHLDELAAFVKARRILIGIVTVPKGVAQEVVNTLVDAGVRAIWNFAPAPLRVPKDIVIKTEDLAASLAMLAGKLYNTGER